MTFVRKRSGMTTISTRAAEPMTTFGRTHDEALSRFTVLGCKSTLKVGGTGYGSG